MTKLSRSKIELFIDCPRCFWLDVKKGIKRPPPAPYTLNNAIDYLLKQEFDLYRDKGTPHPIMMNNKIKAVPWKTPEMNKWRHNFTGVAYHHEPTDFLVYGAIDDLWLNQEKEIHVVDYKATGANQHQIYDSYGRQMEIYQWLFRKNKIKVSPIGYFVFARVSKANGFSNQGALRPGSGQGGALPFDIFVEPYKGDDSWIEETLKNARIVFESDEVPKASASCVHCEYRARASTF